MRRVSASKKKSQREIMASNLSQVVNNLLSENLHQSRCTFLSKSQNHSAVSSPAYQKSRQAPSTGRDKKLSSYSTPQNKMLAQTQFSGFNFKSESVERKNLRPKSSVLRNQMSLGGNRNERGRSAENPKDQTAKKSESKEKLSQDSNCLYKLAENDNSLQRLASQPPNSIVSSKPVGQVRGYAVNSHRFFLKLGENSETRIIILANLTKTKRVSDIVSLFAIFQSSNSAVFVDFLKQNLQEQLIKLLGEQKNVNEELIDKAIRRMEQKFYLFYRIKKKPSRKTFNLNSFGLSYSMMLCKNKQIFMFTKGTTKIIVSKLLGKRIDFCSPSHLRMMKICDEDVQDIDYILLINEGASLAHKDIHKEIWLQVMKAVEKIEEKLIRQSAEFHILLGKVIDSIIKTLSTTMTFKNLSYILCAMKNVEQIICTENRELNLPLIDTRVSATTKFQQNFDLEIQ